MKRSGPLFRLYLAAHLRFEKLFRPANYHRPLPRPLLEFQAAHPLAAPPVRALEGGLAVVVPCFNHAAYLEDTLACLAAQTYRPFEAVFVDDCSTDGTYAALQRLLPQLPAGIRPTLLRTPSNLGQCAALNLAIEYSRAALITVLNDDDYLMHDALEAALAVLDAHPSIYLLGAHSRPFAGPHYLAALPQAEKLVRSQHPQYSALPLDLFNPVRVAAIRHPQALHMSHSGSTFFKSAWQAAGGYWPERRRRVEIHSDRDFQLRVAALLPVAVTTAVFAFWRADSSVDRGRNS